MRLKKLLITALLLLQSSCVPVDDDSCRFPFAAGATLGMTSGGKGATVESLDMRLDVNAGAELSDIVISISLPKEVLPGKGGSSNKGVVMSTTGNQVTYRYTESLRERSSLCGIHLYPLEKRWSKPIEVEFSFVFRQLRKCNDGRSSGYYSKRVSLNVNPEDGKFTEKEGRIDYDWVYDGPR